MTQICVARVPDDPALAAACLDVMRGALSDCPFDREQVVRVNDLALACRLASLAPEADAERLPHVDRATALAFAIDARLDDRAHLCRALGTSLDTPDGTLVAKAWQRWGDKALQLVQGDYALVVADLDLASIVCARDAMGVRPLFFARLQRRGLPEGLLVASDVRPLRAALAHFDDTGPTLDAAFIVAHLRDNMNWHPTATFTAQIRRVPPGHLLRWRPGKALLHRWWHPERIAVNRQITFEDAVHRVRPVLEQAVRDRLRTHAPVALHISGGLDSSLTAALSTAELRTRGASPALCWTWTPPSTEEPAPLDWALTQSAARHLQLDVRSIDFSTDDARAYLRLDPVDLPLESSMAYEQKGLTWAAQAGARLVVSGWGGDEAVSFHGAAYHADLFLRGRWVTLLDELRRMGVWRPRALLGLLAGPFLPRNRADRRRWRNGPEALTPWAARSVTPLASVGPLPVLPRAQMLWRLTQGRLSHRLESCAAFGDRKGVFYVYPLLDRRVIEAVVGFDPNVFRRDREHRRLARALAAPLLPEDVVRNRFKGDRSTVERYKSRLREAIQDLDEVGRMSGEAVERLRFVRADWLGGGRLNPSLEPLDCFIDALMFARAAR